MGKIYKYSSLPGLEKTGILAPLVPVTFINRDYNFSTLALVDSGAEKAVISTVIAEALGIDWSKLKKEQGLTLSGGFIFHNFDNLEAEIDENFFVLSVTIVEGISPFKCILGRNDFFKVADISFRGYKNEFEISFRELN